MRKATRLIVKMRSRRTGVGSAMLLLLPLLCALQALVLMQHIDRPGLYYDEILFVNAAVGGVTDQFVALRIGGVPVMLMHYIGALKAWIWAPIFALWDVDPASVRVPAIMIGLCGNLLACVAMGVWFGRTAAVVTALATCFDPTVGMQSRLDWGPNAIMFLCRGGFLLSVAWATTGRTWRGLLGMAVFAAAGCFDKLSFLWIALPGLVSFAVIERDLLRRFAREHRTALLAWGTATCLVVGAFLALALIVPLQSTRIAMADRPLQAARLLWEALAGDGAISVVYWGKGGRHGAQAAALVGALSLAAALGLRASQSQPAGWKRSWLWLAAFAALVVLMFVGTRAATGPHHAAVIGGLWQLPLIPPIAAAITRARVNRRWAIPAVQCALVGVVAVTSLGMTWQRVSALAAPPVNPNWDPANWRLAQFMVTATQGPVVFTDWGMANHTIATTRGRRQDLSDAWPSFLTDDGALDALRRHGTAALYCLRMPRFESMRGNRDRFLAAAAALGLAPVRVQSFKTEGGDEMIELVRLVPAAR